MSPERRRLWIGIAGILLLALVITTIPSGEGVVELIGNAVQAGFLLLIGFGLTRLYRNQSDWLNSLTDRDRGIVYGAFSVALLAIVAVARFRSLWDGGIVLVLLILGACGFVVYEIWRRSHEWTI